MLTGTTEQQNTTKVAVSEAKPTEEPPNEWLTYSSEAVQKQCQEWSGICTGLNEGSELHLLGPIEQKERSLTVFSL